MITRHIHFDSVPSTHAYAMEHGSELPDWTVITADFQTEGRGRRGREWISGREDSLLLSIILKPKIPPQKASLITPILSVAVAEVLDGYEVKTSIRWPNDVMVGDEKIGGILAEASLEGNMLAFVVASLGLNSRQDKATMAAIDRPATSLLVKTGKQHSYSTLQMKILKRFDWLYKEFLSDGFSRIFGLWRGKMSMIGEDVLIDLGTHAIEGRIESFNDDGSIVIEDRDGKMNVLHSGEVVRLNQK